LLSLACGLACGKGSSESATPDGGTPTEEQCSRLGGDVYVDGIEHASADGRLRVKILEAVPAPPGAGDNTWTVQLLDSYGAAVTSAVPVVKVTNPSRGLEAPRSPVVTPVDPAKGTYRASPIVLGLTGPWQIDVSLGDHGDGGAASVASFSFCVEN
jgi:hypothetical protein